MTRRWTRRGAFAAGLSVALHLLLLASGMPRSAPVDTSIEHTEVQLLLRRPETARARTKPAPPSNDRTERPVQPDKAVPSRPLLAARSVELPVEQPLPIEPPELTAEEDPRPPPPTVELPTLPAPREAARRKVVSDIAPPPSREAVVIATVNSLLEGYLPPPTNDRSPMPELRPDGQGNLVHENGAFLATIRPDGSVLFGRNRGGSIEGFSGKSLDPAEQEILDLHWRIPGVPITVFKASEGDCARGNCEDTAGLGLAFRPNADLNDLFLRAKGDDPLAAKKRRFLRLTRDLRDHLATSYTGKTLSRSKLRASRHLERLWSDLSVSFATKRGILFQLWDECEEPTSDDDLREVAQAGQRSRDHILRFVEKNLPITSPEAFSQDELRSLNTTRESTQAFAPYE